MKSRKHYIAPISWMAFIFILSSIPSDAYSKIGISAIIGNMMHIPLYGILAFLWLRTFKVQGLPIKKALIYSIVITLIYAAFDEFHQSFVLGRDASLGDVFLDGIGCLGVLFIYKRRIK